MPFVNDGDVFFLYRLCRDMGEADPRRMRARMTYRDFLRWQAFYSVEAKLRRGAD